MQLEQNRRTALVQFSRAVPWSSRQGPPQLRSKAARSNAWIQALLARRPRLVVAIALANKTARIVWAVMAKGQSYRPAVPV